MAPDLYDLADDELERQREEAEALRDGCREDGQHMIQTISRGGYDVCFNCGSRS